MFMVVFLPFLLLFTPPPPHFLPLQKSQLFCFYLTLFLNDSGKLFGQEGMEILLVNISDCATIYNSGRGGGGGKLHQWETCFGRSLTSFNRNSVNRHSRDIYTLKDSPLSLFLTALSLYISPEDIRKSLIF